MLTLREEDRLTIPHANYEVRKVQGGYTAYWTKASKLELMNRLGEYEDIGITPEAVRALKAMYMPSPDKEQQ